MRSDPCGGSHRFLHRQLCLDQKEFDRVRMPETCLHEFLGDAGSNPGRRASIAKRWISSLPLDSSLLQTKSEPPGENDGVVRHRSIRRIQPLEHELAERTRGIELIGLLERLDQVFGSQRSRLDLQIRERFTNQLGRFSPACLGLGAGRCEVRFVLRRPSRQDRDGGQRSERDGEHAGGGDGETGAVPGDESSRDVCDRLGPGFNRKAIEVPLQIRDEFTWRGVSTRRFSSQRLEDDDVEIAVETSADAIDPTVSDGGDLLCGIRIDGGRGHRFAGSDRLGLELGVANADISAIDVRERQASCEQFIENHSERIDVRTGSDRIARELFRSRVIGGEHAFTRLGHLAAHAADVRVHDLRDTEVQKLRITVGGHENVVGLDVPMNHEILMRMLYRERDSHAEGDAIVDRETFPVAVGADRDAFDEFHGEPRSIIFQSSAVDQSRDVRMIQ